MRAAAAAVASSVVLAAGVGAVGVADTSTEGFAARGTITDALAIDDVWVDAERVFAKVDVDRNGEIDVNEYAAQALVFAGMARFDGSVMIDGRETLRIGLGAIDEAGLGAAERSAIDAVARADYYEAVAQAGRITSRAWVELRLEAFAAADRNEDGQLTGGELTRYAEGFARYAG